MYGKQKALLSIRTVLFGMKTGRFIAGMEHRTQTILCTFLVEERYGVKFDRMALLYPKRRHGSRLG